MCICGVYIYISVCVVCGHAVWAPDSTYASCLQAEEGHWVSCFVTSDIFFETDFFTELGTDTGPESTGDPPVSARIVLELQCVWQRQASHTDAGM